MHDYSFLEQIKTMTDRKKILSKGGCCKPLTPLSAAHANSRRTPAKSLSSMSRPPSPGSIGKPTENENHGYDRFIHT